MVSRLATPKAGFDDDFSSFVVSPSSASSAVFLESPEDLSTPPRFIPLTPTGFSFDSPPISDVHASFDTTSLVHGGLYKSLGSVLDFGDLANSDGEDDDMLSQMEIAGTSHEIFGAMPLALTIQEQSDTVTALGGVSLQSCPSRGTRCRDGGCQIPV